MQSMYDDPLRPGHLRKLTSLSERRVTLGQPAETLTTSAKDGALEPMVELEKARNELIELKRANVEKDKQLNTANAELSETQEQLEQLRCEIQRLQADLDRQHALAREQGYQAGLDAAEQDSSSALKQQSELWWSGIEKLIEQDHQFHTMLKAQMADLVMASVTKIIGEQSLEPQSIGASIDHIVREGGELRDIQIFVAPKHYEALQSAGLALRTIRGRAVEVLPDPRVEYGGCLIEARNGVIDGRFEIQLEKLRAIVQAESGS